MPEYIDPTCGTRKKHLAWAKERALEFADRGENQQALFSLFSDLSKHPETRNHIAKQLGTELYLAGHLLTREQMRNFIEGVN